MFFFIFVRKYRNATVYQWRVLPRRDSSPLKTMLEFMRRQSLDKGVIHYSVICILVAARTSLFMLDVYFFVVMFHRKSDKVSCFGTIFMSERSPWPRHRRSAQAVPSTLFHCLCWRPWRIPSLRRTRLSRSKSDSAQQWEHGRFKLLIAGL